MYHYVEDRNFLGQMRKKCDDIINQLTQSINNDTFMEVRKFLVGSGAKNLVTQNGGESVDLDYNLEILALSSAAEHNGKAVKEYVREKFDAVLRKNGLQNCGDSTSVLPSHKMRVKGHKTEFSIDLAIVRQRDGKWERLIHEKTGIVQADRWIWNQSADLDALAEKAECIREDSKLWQELRRRYLDKKNLYLTRGDRDHPSYKVYEETVNEVYHQYFEERFDETRRSNRTVEVIPLR